VATRASVTASLTASREATATCVAAPPDAMMARRSSSGSAGEAWMNGIETASTSSAIVRASAGGTNGQLAI
jgi:hypothetical protein